jgi:hypothetical protein
MIKNLCLPGVRQRLPLVLLVVLLALLLWWSTAAAQPPKESRLRPSYPVGVDRFPGFSIKEQYRRWRRELESRNQAKPLPEPVRSPDGTLAESFLIDEGFEGATFPPSGWSSKVVAGTSADWVRSSGSPHSGSFGAYSEFGTDTSLAKKYLVTKRVSINGALNHHLTFWMRRGFVLPFDPDTVYIRMSTTDSLPGSFTTTLFKCYTGPDTSTNPNIYTTTYKQFLVSFTGTTGVAWLAFDHEDRSGQSIDLDDIQLSEIVNNDVAAVSVDVPASGSKRNLNSTFQPKGTFLNNGLASQTSIPVRFKIYTSGGTLVYNDAKTIASLAPGVSTQVTFSNFTPTTPGSFIARIFAQNPGDTNPANDSTEVSYRVRDDISGVRTVGPGGDFTTLTDAVRYLNDNNVAGPLTFSLTGSSYAEGPVSVEPISYTSSVQPVVIQPASGISAVVSFTPTPAAPYGFRINGGTSLTLNGSNNNSLTRNLTMSVDTSGFFAPAVEFTNGCKNMTLKNAILRGYRISDGTANDVVMVDTTLPGLRDSNLVFDNLQVARGFDGFFLRGPSAKSFKITVSNCDIGGTGTDAITQAGIDASNIDSLTIRNTGIHDMAPSQAIYDLFGIFLGDRCTNAQIYSNKIYALHHTVNSHFSQGVVSFAGGGSNLLCFNNFIYDIRSSGVGANANVSLGIYSLPDNRGERYYYNSINMFGNDSSSSLESFSTGLWLDDGAATFQVVDNIVKNSMTFGGSGSGNKGFCLVVSAGTWPAASTSNRNDLYPAGAQGVVGSFNNLNLVTLANWQTGTGQDANSLSADPPFLGNADLHIQTSGSPPVNGKGTPIAGITRDIDGDTRSGTTPDIGADEFTSFSGTTGTFPAGWNMISLPVHLGDSSVGAVFPSGRSSPAFAYSGSYVVRPALTPGEGYWQKFSSQQIVSVVGLPRQRDTLDVSPGWNLIGSLSSGIPYGTVIASPPIVFQSKFFGYNAGYFVTDTLQPWRAYWVKVSGTGQLVLGGGSAIPKSVPAGSVSALNRLTLEDASGMRQELFFGYDDDINAQEFEMPPPQPSGGFDARFASGRMVDVARGTGSYRFPVRIVSATYPVRIRWEIRERGTRAFLVSGDIKIPMERDGAFDVKGPGDVVAVSGETGPDVPKEFNLGQNYPNPFNPSTVIRYQLAVPSFVLLTIYDGLGREVRTLVEGDRDAGYESVEWNSENNAGALLPSGVYFYRLEAISLERPAKSFIQSRKMLLLK